jgi:mycofactocin precursor
VPETADVKVMQEEQATRAQANPPAADGQAEGGSGPQPAATAAPVGIESELLIEDVSIDGMCGVY